MGKQETKIAEMLQENTGTHFLDSGDAYGRHWQRNQGRDFSKEKPVALSFKHEEISFTYNLFHWMNEKLCWDDDANKSLDAFEEFVKAETDDDYSYFELAEEFPKWHAAWAAGMCEPQECEECYGDGQVDCEDWVDYEDPETCDTCHGTGKVDCANCKGTGEIVHAMSYSKQKGLVLDCEPACEAAGLYGEGEPMTVNTYNEENLLSQDMQFTYFELNHESYAVIQVHGGADVRGGYTRPQVFTCGSTSELAVFDYKNGTIWCSGADHQLNDQQLDLGGGCEGPCDDAYWYTDDGYHWYYQGSCGSGAGTQLEDYDFVKIVDEEEWLELSKGFEHSAASPDVTISTSEGVFAKGWVKGKLCVEEDGTGRCPFCGGRLEGSF